MAQRRSKRITTSSRRAHPQWAQFQREFRGDPRLELPELYSMPKRLIDVLAHYVPAVITAEDVRFETRLRDVAATGFCHREPMFSTLLDEIHLNREFSADAIRDSASSLRMPWDDQFRDLMATDHFGPMLNERRESFMSREREAIRQRLLGYAGWLVTHPAYQEDLLRFRVQHAPFLQRPQEMPKRDRLNAGPLPPENPPDNQSDFRFQSLVLLDRWALAGWTTLRLPEPRTPGLFVGDRVPANGISPVGVSMFLPWPLLSDHHFQFEDLIQFYRSRVDLSHLQEWLTGVPNWSYERFGKLFEMYLYRQLALETRYAQRLDRQAERLDRAFAAYWEPAESSPHLIDRKIDSVRLIRRKLTRRLRACEQHLQSVFPEIANSDQPPNG